MKTCPYNPLARTLLLNLLAAALLVFAALPARAKIFDGGVDSANLGKGDWIYYISQATNQLGGNVPSVTDIPSFMAYEKSQGMDYIIVKMGTGSTNFNGGGSSPQFNQALIDAAHAADLKIFGYTRSYGDDIPGEVAMAADCYNLGADGFIFDAEMEWEDEPDTNAWIMLSQVKTNFPTKFLGHAPFPYISFHTAFPYREFGYWCDAVMPQCYWHSIGVTPQQMVNDLDSEWRNWQNGLTGQWTNAVKPIVPIGQADAVAIPGSEITDFVNALKNSKNPATSGGYQGVNWWRADLHEPAQWTAIGGANIGNAMGTVNDIIMDNISATYVGTFSTASSSTDKYHTDYRYKGQGTGASYAQFKPSIWTPGNYQISEWHPQGSNRAFDAPVQITYTGGNTTVPVNQQINGGIWNFLGTFNMAEGTGNKHVRLKDNFSTAGQLVMADAVKFSYVAPSIPSAPSGLTATTASSTKIDLAWTDNASNEQWYVVRRSTTAGGPYTTVMTLAPNATSYSDRPLTPSSTYYYVVRAVNAGGSSTISNEDSATTFPEITIDNPSATVVGTWSTGTSSADKYGTDYRNKGSGTGAAYLQYTPSISTAGDYEIYAWYPQGSNRTTNAPYVVTYNGGSATVRVNQKVNGGKWNLLGTFNLATGTAGNVRIQDNFTDVGQLVMADAVKFVMVGGTPQPPPAAPSGLSATAISTSQINLSWTDNSNDESNFIVGRSTTSGGPYTDIVTLGANVTSYNNTGLSAGTTYYYVVRASNAAGSSANSNQASATTTENPPVAPSGLSATTVSSSQINLSWADNSSNEDNFIVARSTTSGGPYTDIATLGANVTSFNNTGLAANTTYYYVVRASNTGGSSANSAQASATTLPNPPAAPSGLTATTASQTQINLSWTDNSANETGFTVARSTTSGGPYSDIVTVGADVTSYNNTGLSANTTYYYVVRGNNAGGSSANSAQASATTMPNAPAAPSGLTATAAGSTQIDLSWTDNSSNEDNFIVARSTTAGGPYTDIATLSANSTSYSNTGLSTGVTYYYVIRAVNTGGASANSNEASATTTSVPNAPSGLTATAARATRINLAWTDNSSNETGFTVARSTTAGGPYTDIVTVAANVTTYNNTGLTANTTYYYVVRASNAAGSSANSAEDNATTYETDLLIDNKSAVVTGVWSTGTAATDKYGTDYRFIGQGTGANHLQYTPWIATAGNYEVYEWHTVGANRPTNAPYVINYDGSSQTVIVNQEVNGGQWNLLGSFNFATSGGYVRITDNFIDPAQVVIADAIKLVFAPPPAAPSGLAATAISTSQINLSWTDNSSNEDNFIVARSTTTGGPYTDVAVLSANSISFSDTGLSANTTYYYVVRSRNASGSSANTAEASATTFPDQTTVTFTSVAAHDGYVLESGETTGVGGTIAATTSGTAGLRIGDDNTDKQQKTVVSFDTSSLPDGATIVSATLKLKRGTVTGTNPFTTHGSCFADIKGGTGFGGANALAIGDFQAVADATQVATMSNPTANGTWSTGTVNATGRGFVNKTGHTQFRVYFSTDDNDDLGNDYMGFYPGDNATTANRPVLEIIYQ